MGYTHYWRTANGCSDGEWKDICSAARQLLANNPDIPLVRSYGETDPPEISEECIQFNGAGDDGLEDFFATPEHTNFEFCKTARLPYDALVVAMLGLMNFYAPFAWVMKSDGEPEDWEEGLALAEEVAGAPVASPFTDW